MCKYFIAVVLLLVCLLPVKGQTIPITQRERSGICTKCVTPYAKWYNHKTYKYYCRDCVLKRYNINQSTINHDTARSK